MWRFWSWFWFRPISAKGTGVMRILIGLIFVMTTLDVFPDLDVLVGPEGIFHDSSAKRGMRLARWTYFDRIDTLGGMQLAHGLALLVNILFMLGFKSRTMGFLSVIAHAALYQRNSWFMNGGDRLVREFGFYLCLVPCGASYSIDVWLKNRKRLKLGHGLDLHPKIPIFAIRLIQIQIAFVYFISGAEKWGSGSWQRGSALYYSLSTDNYVRSDWLVSPLLDGRFGYEILKVGTYLTLYWECFFWLLVLWRPTRWLAIIIGFAMHAGIHLTLMVAFFSGISMWAYLAFLPYNWVEWCEGWWRQRQASAKSS
jgi:hypothetical protein